MTTATESTALAEIRHQGTSLSQEIEALIVSDQETLEIASGYRQAVKSYLKRADDFMRPILEAAKETLDTAKRQWKGLRAPGETALERIDGKFRRYDAERRALAEEERRRAEIERARVEDEARLRAALEAEAAGDERGAEAILESPHPPEPVFVPPPVVERVKAEGFHFRSDWEAEVVDFPALVQAWLVGQAPADSVVPHLPPLNALARKHRGLFNVPGVRAVEKRVPTGRTA